MNTQTVPARTLEQIEARYPRLIAAMKWAAILSTSEAACAIRDLRDLPLSGGGEAVAHFGGPLAVVKAAIRNRSALRLQGLLPRPVHFADPELTRGEHNADPGWDASTVAEQPHPSYGSWDKAIESDYAPAVVNEEVLEPFASINDEATRAIFAAAKAAGTVRLSKAEQAAMPMHKVKTIPMSAWTRRRTKLGWAGMVAELGALLAARDREAAAEKVAA